MRSATTLLSRAATADFPRRGYTVSMCTRYMPPDQQDKRSVIPIEIADVDQWLHGSTEEVQALIRVPPVEAFEAGPEK